MGRVWVSQERKMALLPLLRGTVLLRGSAHKLGGLFLVETNGVCCWETTAPTRHNKAGKRVQTVKGGKTIHIKDNSILNGSPAVGHKIGCKPARAAAVYAEAFKQKASQEVRGGISTVENARLNNHANMNAACDEAVVNKVEVRKNWNVKSINARLSYNKTSRVSQPTTEGGLPQELTVTVTRKPFLRFESDDGNIMVFISDLGLDLLRKAPMWKADGTFKSALKNFMQVYTIHARHPRGETVPALYALMKRKTQTAYRQLFRWLNSALEDNELIGALHTILIDFEPAAKMAFECELQTADRQISIKGCRFHFGQAVSRNFDKKGLKPLRGDEVVGAWLRQLLGLPLLPPEFVRMICNSSLRHHPRIHGYSRQFKNFVAYFENQWLSSDDYISHWNHWDNDLCRTTNSAEGWHSGIKATWSGARPALNMYVEWLKKKEYEHATRLVQLDDESFAVKKRVAVYAQLDERIRQAKTRFTALQLLEADATAPNMVPLILRHSRHVASLLGHTKKKGAAPAAPPTDPASISLFKPVESIDKTFMSVINAAVSRCPALVHTYLPPALTSARRRPS
uniref:MULE transposase domain-containing protein n=1 Tax=Plectus sambesii TaxID=2011161 RepID=A0A914WSV9_9BILA